MNTVKLAYDVFYPRLKSDGLPIILTHGYYWCKYLFQTFGQELADTSKCVVYSLDLRNHGESPAPKGLTMELMAEDVREFMNDNGLQKVNFVCHSLSSTIPFLIHWTEPHRVEKMVMIDMLPFHYHSKENVEKFAVPQVVQQKQALKLLESKMSLSEAKSKFFKLALNGSISQRYYYRKIAYDLTKVNGNFTFKTDLDYLLERYMNKHLSPDYFGPSHHDILIVRCEGSDKVPTEDYNKYQHLVAPRSKLVTMRNTTHLLMFERQEEFIQLVIEFFQVDSNFIPDIRIL